VSAGSAATALLNSDPMSYGLTYAEGVDLEIGASYDNGVWKAVLLGITGKYSVQTRMRPNVSEVAGTTNGVNFCKQVEDLFNLGYSKGTNGLDNNLWYTLPAVQAHEDVHVSRAYGAMSIAIYDIMAEVVAATVPCTNGKTKAQAILELRIRLEALDTRAKCRKIWDDTWDLYWLAADHAPGGPCYVAEHAVAEAVWQGICNTYDPGKTKCPTCSLF
jgi:hypothetical protein